MGSAFVLVGWEADDQAFGSDGDGLPGWAHAQRIQI